MAAYRQIVQNHTETAPADANNPFLHKALVEKVIIGADVVQAAIHLTAATLAAMSPTVRFDQMLLHTFRLGMDADRKVWLGSLEWLEAPEIQSFFSSTEEQIGAMSNTGSIVQRPAADLVISNPPFTRRGSDGGKEEAISRVFSLPKGEPKSIDAIKKRTAALLKGTAANQIAGHGSSFAVLADRLVNRGGRIAMVLPVTALFGESWSDVRRMLVERYEVEFVVSSHDPAQRSMSYDTGIAEALLVARRLREDEQPSGRGRFVNLWRAPYQETDALALIRAVNAAASTPLLALRRAACWRQSTDGWRRAVGRMPLTALLWKAPGHQPGGRGAVTRPASHLPLRGVRFGRKTEQELRDTCPYGSLWVMSVAWGQQHRQIRGSLGDAGAFEAYHGWNGEAQFPAIWKHRESTIHQSIIAEPNAWLVPEARTRPHTNLVSSIGHVPDDG